jgi:hypothetical protein
MAGRQALVLAGTYAGELQGQCGRCIATGRHSRQGFISDKSLVLGDSVVCYTTPLKKYYN